jgi:hypothetical protein
MSKQKITSNKNSEKKKKTLPRSKTMTNKEVELLKAYGRVSPSRQRNIGPSNTSESVNNSKQHQFN